MEGGGSLASRQTEESPRATGLVISRETLRSGLKQEWFRVASSDGVVTQDSKEQYITACACDSNALGI